MKTPEQTQTLELLKQIQLARREKTSPSELLAVLRSVHERFGEIPMDAIALIARHFGVPESQVYSTCTFYPELSQKGRRRESFERELERVFNVLSPKDPIVWCGAPGFSGQTRRVLARCGILDPLDYEAFRLADAYRGYENARAISPAEVIDVIESSRLRGRGGAGFSAGRKWRTARQTASDQKFLVCNAAEGDIGAWMDRALLEGDPHLVFEGMAIASYAVGATKAYLYLRSEYAYLESYLKTVLKVVRETGVLKDCDIEIFVAAGAYVCGEETSLLNSMEGKAGRPRMRPPFPAQEGLWGKPTVVNNVKTLAQVPLILRHGAEWYSSVGTPQSTGTAILCLGGDVENPGVLEVAMGTSLREVIFGIGKGARGGKRVKAIQTGGPLGGFIPGDQLDVPVSFESFAALGSPLGSGGLIVISEDRCMVRLARDFSSFSQEESCGNCAPCRLGTQRVAEILDSACKGRAAEHDLEQLESLGEMLTTSSFCAFGQGAPSVALSALSHFRAEFEDHVARRHCAAGICFPSSAMAEGRAK